MATSATERGSRDRVRRALWSPPSAVFSAFRSCSSAGICSSSRRRSSRRPCTWSCAAASCSSSRAVWPSSTSTRAVASSRRWHSRASRGSASACGGASPTSESTGLASHVIAMPPCPLRGSEKYPSCSCLRAETRATRTRIRTRVCAHIREGGPEPAAPAAGPPGSPPGPRPAPRARAARAPPRSPRGRSRVSGFSRSALGLSLFVLPASLSLLGFWERLLMLAGTSC